MYKKTLTLFLIFGLCMLASGFANGQGEATTPKQSELKIFVPQSPGVVDGVKAIADAYMQKSPQVTITVRSVPFNRYKEQLQVMWASNDVDDIITTGSPDISNYAYYGALLPLDDILPQGDKSQFIQSAIDAVTYNGKIYAYPFREAASAIFYNKDYFKLAGIEPTPLDKPWTWNEWEQNVKTIRTAVKQKTGKDVWGITFLSNPGRGDFWLTPIIRSAGSPGSPTYQAISPDGLTLHGYADTPQAMQAYQFYQDLYTKEKLAPTAEVPDAFGTGQSITFLSFLSSANSLLKDFPDLSWGIMPMPYFKTPLTHTGGFTYAISAKSKNPTVAKDFVKFAGSDEGIKTYFNISGSDLLSRKGFSERYPQYFEDPNLQIFSQILEKYGQARPNTPGYVLYNSIIGFNLFLDLASGADIQKTVESKINEFETQVRSM
ncbi:sugar ABC transporter substrate-binding protein [uncultured Sphaerochaeta sp.]|uniref:ABC transporter substrate-binding protein n=1 Tax=uncultured Sphaerochaeta sp. TaxID=886478 RepID=UPI002A0A2BB6|nr:sugar ABC transporter substrate-binding protein [uncultured Sphaerochaeta sp.]